MSKKIVFFTGAMGRGGAERVISILSNYYANLGWEVKIGMLLHSNIEYDLNPKVEVVNLSSSLGIKLGFLQTVGNVRRFVNKENPNVIVSFMAQICLIAGLALKKGCARLIMSERIDPSQVGRGFFFRKLLDRTYKKADVFVVQTERAKNYFCKEIQDISVIIANPIKVYAHTNLSSKRIVTAGRLTTQKNHKMLISAFSKIKKIHPEYTLTIYGEGPLRRELEEQVSSLGLEDSVSLPGNVPDLHHQISDAEIFVLPSDFEGLSNALLEAMMMGFPVISTNCAGSDEIIKDMENGILVNIGNEDALVAAMDRLVSTPDLKTELSERAKKTVEYCKVDSIISKWSEVIDA